MWTSICRWIATRFGGYTSARIDQLEERVIDNDDRLNFRIRQFDVIKTEFFAMRERFQEQILAAAGDVAEANRTIRQLNTALDEEREKVKVHEMTINTLVAAHGLVLERFEADTAIEIQRKVGTMPAPRD